MRGTARRTRRVRAGEKDARIKIAPMGAEATVTSLRGGKGCWRVCPPLLDLAPSGAYPAKLLPWSTAGFPGCPSDELSSREVCSLFGDAMITGVSGFSTRDVADSLSPRLGPNNVSLAKVFLITNLILRNVAEIHKYYLCIILFTNIIHK